MANTGGVFSAGGRDVPQRYLPEIVAGDKIDLLVITPDRGIIIPVGLHLAQVSIKMIETLVIRMTLGIGTAQTPFAHRAGFVTCLFENFRYG